MFSIFCTSLKPLTSQGFQNTFFESQESSTFFCSKIGQKLPQNHNISNTYSAPIRPISRGFGVLMSTPKPPEMGMIGLLYVREKSQKSIFRLNPFFRSTPAAQTQHGEMPKICLKSNFSLTNNWLIRLPSGHIVVPMGTTKPPEMDRIGQLYV